MPTPDTMHGMRCTTLIQLGLDAGVARLIPHLSGEVNLLLVERDARKVQALRAEVDHPNMDRPDRVRLVLNEQQLEQAELADFLMAGLRIVAAPGVAPGPLELATLRAVKAHQAALARQRAAGSQTWITMVTYDRLELTRMTLDQLAGSTQMALKLVIVDNGSTDGTRQWLQRPEVRRRYPFIARVMLMDRNLGIGRALNNGLLYCLARSHRVGRLDNDILVPPGWLEDLTRVLNDPLAPQVVCGLVRDDPEVGRILQHGARAVAGGLEIHLVETIGGCCNLFAPGLFERMGLLPEEPLYGVEDGGLCRAVRDAGQAVAVVDRVELGHLSVRFPDSDEYQQFKGDQLRHWIQRHGDDQPVNEMASDPPQG